MNDLSTVKFLDSATAISVAFPDVSQRYAYKKLIDAVKAVKQKTPDVVRADIEVQVSLADAIDEALVSGDAKRGHNTAFQLGTHEIPCAEVDRWRKLRAIPDHARREYYTDIPKPSRNGILKYWAARCVDIKAVADKPEAESVEVPEGVDLLDNLPRSHFGCMYADPPWQYGNQGTRAATDNHYGTMTIADLCAMPISEIAADDAHLHLWTTNAFIKESFELIDAWGFEYRSMFIWVKPQMGIGNYWRNSHEIMLLAIKGGQTALSKGEMSWLECGRGKHSSKPDRVRESIERLSPGPYLELFGRRKIKGWAFFGNQIMEELI